MDTSGLSSLSVAALSALRSAEGFSEAYAAAQYKKQPGVRNVVGPTPTIPIQPRNKPCGCGSGTKAKKCCGKYPNLHKPKPTGKSLTMKEQ